jgi:hypothetical protein
VERTLGTHWIGGWVGPRAGLDTEGGGKILCLYQGLNLIVLYFFPLVDKLNTKSQKIRNKEKVYVNILGSFTCTKVNRRIKNNEEKKMCYPSVC